MSGHLSENFSRYDQKLEFILRTAARIFAEVRAWLDEDCVLDPDAWTPGTELFGSYQQSTWGDTGAKMLYKVRAHHLPLLIPVDKEQANMPFFRTCIRINFGLCHLRLGL